MVCCSKNSLTQWEKTLFLEFDFLHQDLVMYSHKNISYKVRIITTVKINSVRYEKECSLNKQTNKSNHNKGKNYSLEYFEVMYFD